MTSRYCVPERTFSIYVYLMKSKVAELASFILMPRIQAQTGSCFGRFGKISERLVCSGLLIRKKKKFSPNNTQTFLQQPILTLWHSVVPAAWVAGGIFSAPINCANQIFHILRGDMSNLSQFELILVSNEM